MKLLFESVDSDQGTRRELCGRERDEGYGRGRGVMERNRREGQRAKIMNGNLQLPGLWCGENL